MLIFLNLASIGKIKDRPFKKSDGQQSSDLPFTHLNFRSKFLTLSHEIESQNKLNL